MVLPPMLKNEQVTVMRVHSRLNHDSSKLLW